ncbi:MAG TPA: hypothetical protein VN764_04105 [Polyangiaceae bacterium]|nr:hypothetical protein [Polyangiaceae bacterium]
MIPKLSPFSKLHLLALGSSLLLTPACNKSHCDDVTDKDFAVKFVITEADDCDYSGTVVRKDDSGDVTEDLTCAEEDGYCTCRGGDEFGTYEVYLENGVTGETEYAEFIAEPNSATCVERTASDFTVLGEGGAGGMGGGH